MAELDRTLTRGGKVVERAREVDRLVSPIAAMARGVVDAGVTFLRNRGPGSPSPSRRGKRKRGRKRNLSVRPSSRGNRNESADRGWRDRRFSSARIRRRRTRRDVPRAREAAPASSRATAWSCGAQRRHRR